MHFYLASVLRYKCLANCEAQPDTILVHAGLIARVPQLAKLREEFLLVFLRNPDAAVTNFDDEALGAHVVARPDLDDAPVGEL